MRPLVRIAVLAALCACGESGRHDPAAGLGPLDDALQVPIHRVRAPLEGMGEAWQIRTPGLRTWVDGERLVLVDRDDGAWRFDLRLEGWGSTRRTAAALRETRADGSRLELVRDGLVEWYLERPDGLEQGFTLEKPPDEPGEVELALRIEGARARRVGSGLLLSTGGQDRVRYDHLAVWDATGRPLPSRLGVEGCATDTEPCRALIRFDPSDAAWPVTVDPLFTTVEPTFDPALSGPGWGGYAVAIDENHALVSVPGTSPSETQGRVYVYARTGSGGEWEQQATLDANVAGFGGSVALDFPLAAVGAPTADTVFLYEYAESGGWSEVARVETESPFGGGAFGQAIALSSDTLVVGEPNAGVGAISMFSRITGWARLANVNLQGDTLSPDAAFGASVAFDGNTLVVGAPGDDAVRIFGRGDLNADGKNEFVRIATHLGPPGFGTGVAADEDFVLASAPGHAPVLYRRTEADLGWDDGAPLPLPLDLGDAYAQTISLDEARAYVSDRVSASNRGMVHVYDLDQPAPGLTETLDVGSATTMPVAVASDASVLIVGLPEEPAVGAFELFRAIGEAYVAEPITPDLPLEGFANLGQRLALSEEHLVVGAPRSDFSGTVDGGLVAILKREEDGTWTQDRQLPSLSPVAEAYKLLGSYGSALALDAHRLAIGASTYDGQGAVVLHDLGGTNPPRVIEAVDGLAGAEFGASIAMQADTLVVGAPGYDGGYGKVYVYDRHGGNSATDSWGQIDVLAAGAPDRFGTSVAIDGRWIVVGSRSANANSGAVSVYTLGEGAAFWTLTDTLDDADPGAMLGSTVAVEGDLIAAAAPNLNSQTGEVRLYRFGPGGWTHEQTLVADLPTPGHVFGAGLDIENGNVYVGVPGANRVNIYTRTDAAANPWKRDRTVMGPVGISFGVEVVANGSLLAVGATGYDGAGTTDEGAVYLYRLDADIPPAGLADSYDALEDSLLVVPAPGVLANDFDANGDALTLTLVDGPTHAEQFDLRNDGSFEYRGVQDYFGDDSFTYVVSSGTPAQSTETVTVRIAVANVNDVCAASSDTFVTQEDVALAVTAPGVLAGDVEVDGDPIEAALSLAPQHGTITLLPDGSFTYVPDENFFGDDAFTYVCSDGSGEPSAPATVSLNVQWSPDPPSASDLAYETPEDQRLVVTPEDGVIREPTDVDGQLVAAALRQPTQHGIVVLRPNGSFDYLPDPGSDVDDTFTYVLVDTDGQESQEATVAIAVLDFNDPPVAADDVVQMIEDQLVPIPYSQIFANDTDEEGSGLSMGDATSPDGFVTEGPSSLEIDLPDDFEGIAVITYTVSDGEKLSNPATIEVHVLGVNDPPIGSDDAYAWDPEGGLSPIEAEGTDVSVLANDIDIDSPLLVAILGQEPRHGRVTLETDGTFLYEPNPGFEGEDIFTYAVSDGALADVEVRVSIDVRDPTSGTGTTAPTEPTGPSSCETSVYYLDRDQDGFGDDDAVVESCAPHPWLVTEGGDCDDGNADIYPGARDIAHDDVDQDCSGEDAVVDPVGVCATGPATSAPWLFLLAPLLLRRREDQ